MPRPLANSTIFANESGNQPASQLDTWLANIRAVINDSASGWANAATDTGGANTYAVTLTPPPSGYVPGFLISMLPANTNTGASTITVNSLGSVSILNISGNALQAGDIVAGQVATMIFIGSSFYLIDQSPSSFPTPVSQFTVAPGPGLSVNVSIIAPQLVLNNTSHFNAGSATPANVALTAPVTNSRYSTVYYDTNAGTFGVVNGTTAASPSLAQIPLPNFNHQIPLAAVLVAAAQSQIVSSNITDLRSIWSQQKQVVVGNSGLISNLSVECYGASKVIINAIVIASVNPIFFLNNLQIGVDVILNVTNASGGTITVKMQANTPDGAAYFQTDFLETWQVVNRVPWGTGGTVLSNNSIYFIGQSQMLGSNTLLRGALSLSLT
jgi:hypothetical protein